MIFYPVKNPFNWQLHAIKFCNYCESMNLLHIPLPFNSALDSLNLVYRPLKCTGFQKFAIAHMSTTGNFVHVVNIL